MEEIENDNKSKEKASIHTEKEYDSKTDLYSDSTKDRTHSRVHEKYGLIETYPGCYVKSYLIGDNNYLTAPEEEQNVYYRGWKKVLNSFGSNVEFALYNDSDEHLITKSRVIDEDGRTKEVKSFDYRNMRSMGLEINDLIAPSSFDIRPEQIQMGNKFARTLRVTNLPSQLNDEFIN